MHADYRVRCEDTWVRILGISFSVLWPLGAPLFLVFLLYVYEVPKLARKKIAKAEQRALVRFCIANSHQQNTLDQTIPDDCLLEDLPDNSLRCLLCAASSVALNFRPTLNPGDQIAMKLLTKFARTKEVAPVPLEERSRQELLDLLEQTRSTMERAEILITPLICWDGSEGEEERHAIEPLGLLI